ncbi:MAG: cell division protein FtsZ [Alphaproteobacteria bacterium]|nr:cell division protein FtsZ [Alphaproteobacteria bacterium]MBU0795672.1 cell division protein FtsZ [Alphaproteobacteria bacterium]MBU0887295.1 cell division protein FtsZ [Alphaproteobacteria bacterium]MBU1811824.1 cell division protein FtsZ [Alphaproteobacteria bacterium]MBU2091740.1 cell division protein FtsZ [Alphaproteobacteria bacterium]
MTINITLPNEPELKPRITVIGVGGAGGNAVNNMIRSNLTGVEFLVANTDAQSIAQSVAERRIQLGTIVTQGLGAGSRPEVGRAAAEASIDEILEHLEGSNMCFITAGMGGGTGTGAAPVIAQAARERNILTVGVVTKPFHFEGHHRMRIADAGIEELQQYVDTLIIIPNQNLFRVANEKTTFADAFKMADDVLHAGVRGVTDLMVMPGLINLDFADIRTVMSEMGKAMMGTGQASGDKRAIDAAEAAINNPLLDDSSMKGARGLLINVTGGADMTLFEVDEAANRIRDEVDSDANIIFGATFDEALEGHMRVSIVATGIEAESATQNRPARPQLSVVASRTRPGGMGTGGMGTASAGAASMSAAPAAAPSFSAMPMSGAMMSGNQAVAYDLMQEEIIETGPVEAVAEAQPQTEAELVKAESIPTAEPAKTAAAPFIAPRPVMPTAQQARLSNPAPVAESRPVETRRPASLFSKMTGLMRGNEPEQAAPSVGRAAPLPPAPAARANPAPQASQQAAAPAQQRPAAPQAPVSAPAATATQPRLGGLDSADRLRASQADEDMLEIPAFLRRQAN